MRYLFSIIFLLSGAITFAQVDSNEVTKTFTLSGYVEAYYLYDFNKPANKDLPPFMYSFNRHNEPNINLGYVKLNYTSPFVRANASVMVGTYQQANLAAEPIVLKNIFELNFGVKLLKKHELWLDIGIMPSHIGFESAIGKDCWNMTRSLLADNSPYFETGGKISYTTANGKLQAAVFVLDGWQRIVPVKGSILPAFGWQLQYVPNEKFTFNSSSFIGTDDPDVTRRMRYFHNFYAILNANNKLAFTTGFDFGAQQQAKGSSGYNWWYSPVLIGKYAFNNSLTLAARIEFYSDKNGVIIATGTPNGFGTMGYSLNVDYVPYKNILLRVEGRLLQSTTDEIFIKGNSTTKLEPFIGLSFSYYLSEIFNLKKRT